MDTSSITARLVVHDGDKSRTVAIDPLPFTIGRQADRNLILSNAQISRQHAIIHHDEDGYFIQDLGSRHGILVNGTRRETTRLQDGDRIQLGASEVTLVFLLPQDHSSTRALLSRISSTPSGGTELEKLSLFLQAAQSFNSTRVLNDVLTTMLEYTLRLTGAERGFVFLGENASTLTLESGLSSDGQPLVDDTKISHSILRDAATSGPLKGLLAYTELPHASCDFNHDPHSAIVDASQTRVSGPRLVNILAWFDNEWGFANRMLDVAEHYLQTASPQL